jgi:exosortase/archaeosortase family protein
MAYIKRNEIFAKIQKESEKSVEISNVIIGLLIIVISIIMPKDAGLAAVVFEMLLAFLGLFVIFFGWAGLYPGILLGIFGFSVGFPIVLSNYLEAQYSLATIWIVSAALKIAGFEFISQGQMINYFSSGGREISLLVDSACSGSGSMSIFIALFALMTLDVRLPGKEAAYMFIFGVVGTTLQNVVRIAVIVFSGFYFGPKGVVASHNYAGYILFPLWFLVFVYIYFMHAKKLSKDA